MATYQTFDPDNLLLGIELEYDTGGQFYSQKYINDLFKYYKLSSIGDWEFSIYYYPINKFKTYNDFINYIDNKKKNSLSTNYIKNNNINKLLEHIHINWINKLTNHNDILINYELYKNNDYDLCDKYINYCNENNNKYLNSMLFPEYFENFVFTKILNDDGNFINAIACSNNYWYYINHITS